MKILIIGHSVKDIIHSGDNEIIAPGGIYYSVLGALSCINQHDNVHLVTAIDEKNKHLYADA